MNTHSNSNMGEERAISVPVVVDSRKTQDTFRMTRCNYLLVQCDSPSAGWVLGVAGESVPFLMFGLSGIIYQPFGAPRFTSPQLIQDLFDRIEGQANLLVDFDDLWIPNDLLALPSEPVSGLVFRIDAGVFAQLMLYRLGRLSLDSLLPMLRERSGSIQSSPEETLAFAQWRDQTLETALGQYPKRSELALTWTERGPEGGTRHG